MYVYLIFSIRIHKHTLTEEVFPLQLTCAIERGDGGETRAVKYVETMEFRDVVSTVYAM